MQSLYGLYGPSMSAVLKKAVKVNHSLTQGNAERNKWLRLKRELYWIKTLGTLFPHGINHKILRKLDDITFLFSSNAVKAFKIQEYLYKVSSNVSQYIQGRIIVHF